MQIPFKQLLWISSFIFLAVQAVPSTVIENHPIKTEFENINGGSILGGPWKAFISYRRAFSRHLAMLIRVLLARENISAFLDVEDLGAGHWDEQILTAIEETPNFIMVLSNGTLDRCIGDHNYTDFLHKEIKAAVSSGRNIIPIFDEYTHPDAEFSPEINELMTFQGVDWNHSLVNATIDRIISYLKIEVNSTTPKTI